MKAICLILYFHHGEGRYKEIYRKSEQYTLFTPFRLVPQCQIQRYKEKK